MQEVQMLSAYVKPALPLLTERSKYSDEAIRNAFLSTTKQTQQQKMVKEVTGELLKDIFESPEIKESAADTASSAVRTARSSAREVKSGFFTSIKNAVAGHKLLSGALAFGALLAAGIGGKKAYDNKQSKKLDKAA